ncbi:hypothetical protein [Virgibacillus phage Mimir87]|nr:hypothetical protein [Virgibacillus phage Mimir87]
MKNLTITLQIEGKEKKFVTPSFNNGLFFRRASDITEMIEGGDVSGQDLDSLYAFVCDVYENKFTIEEFEEGTDSRVIIKTVYAVANHIMGNIAEAAKLLGGEVADDQGKSN